MGHLDPPSDIVPDHSSAMIVRSILSHSKLCGYSRCTNRIYALCLFQILRSAHGSALTDSQPWTSPGLILAPCPDPRHDFCASPVTLFFPITFFTSSLIVDGILLSWSLRFLPTWYMPSPNSSLGLSFPSQPRVPVGPCPKVLDPFPSPVDQVTPVTVSH